ncbi:MAG: MotA/TolQ/ExbB proton channel family protein [Myxococcales bacterium]|nr:MotA/TolQ/ExbB proton channel family protein [Myxococcales bacterium]
MADALSPVRELMTQGGFVMWWLVPSAFLLWYAVGDRMVSLRRGDTRPLGQLVDAFLQGQGHERGVIGEALTRTLALPPSHRTPGRITEALSDLYIQVGRYRGLIQSIAATAPLVGLLGTVTGMISTFDALTTSTLFARAAGSGVAGGISVALVSTQMGLSVAIPGLLVGRLLEQRQTRLEDELDRLGDLLRERSLPGVSPPA